MTSSDREKVRNPAKREKKRTKIGLSGMGKAKVPPEGNINAVNPPPSNIEADETYGRGKKGQVNRRRLSLERGGGLTCEKRKKAQGLRGDGTLLGFGVNLQESPSRKKKNECKAEKKKVEGKKSKWGKSGRGKLAVESGRGQPRMNGIGTQKKAKMAGESLKDQIKKKRYFGRKEIDPSEPRMCAYMGLGQLSRIKGRKGTKW